MFVLFHVQVAHGAIQFTAYEELRKLIIDFRHKQVPSKEKSSKLLASPYCELLFQVSVLVCYAK